MAAAATSPHPSSNSPLPPISEEQKKIVKQIRAGRNVIVEAVAGSGKTTCNLYLAINSAAKKILLLTYNSKLRLETREKAHKCEINNMEVHSYHSFCVKYYNHNAYTDFVIKDIILKKQVPKVQFEYDIIILDEAQDITPTYYELVCKVIHDNAKASSGKPAPQLCLLGDRFQSIYGYNMADCRYLTLADQLFNLNSYPWARCYLSVSYRLTEETANFVNRCMGGRLVIKTAKSNKSLPQYNILDCRDTDRIIGIIMKFLSAGYKPGDIFILAPSIKIKNHNTVLENRDYQISPIKKLENTLKTQYPEIPIYVPCTDSEKLDVDVLAGKILFSTFHQSKGLERPIVIVYNFDASYFTYYKRNADKTRMPNELYVATTRPSEHLVLLHGQTNERLDFVGEDILVGACRVNGFMRPSKKPTPKMPNETRTSITVMDILSHLNFSIILKALDFIEWTAIRHIGPRIKIPPKIVTSSGFENVSDITGTSIPAYYELRTLNRMTIYDRLQEDIRQNGIRGGYSSHHRKPFDVRKIQLEKLNLEELLYLANEYNATQTGYIFKTYQIQEYKWLSHENMEECCRRLDSLKIGGSAIYESSVSFKKGVNIFGCMDCVDGNRVFEFKCVECIGYEHLLQLAIYMFLYESHLREGVVEQPTDDNLKKEYYLYNILNDNLIKVVSTYSKLHEMYEFIMNSKNISDEDLHDEEFVARNVEIQKKYVS